MTKNNLYCCFDLLTIYFVSQYNVLTGVSRIFQQGGGGAKRESEATERGKVLEGSVPPPPPPSQSHGIYRETFEFRVSKWHFCTLNVITRPVLGYVKCHIYQSPTPPPPPPLQILFYSYNNRGGGECMVPFSYASDSGAARIVNLGAKARERSERARGGCGRGVLR